MISEYDSNQYIYWLHMLVYAYITGIHMFKHITSVIHYHTGTKYILTYILSYDGCCVVLILRFEPSNFVHIVSRPSTPSGHAGLQWSWVMSLFHELRAKEGASSATSKSAENIDGLESSSSSSSAVNGYFSKGGTIQRRYFSCWNLAMWCWSCSVASESIGITTSRRPKVWTRSSLERPLMPMWGQRSVYLGLQFLPMGYVWTLDA